ncbi:MAG: ABC transporter substrate-binding protein [Desulfobacteraceae bacterium]|nr:ABC transporter substrate-binding protein [Desulfobacteraceae bacterium]MDH3723697.1 ABC transporter substrate-binding protein [Desulfobacteraceae bacterium]
MRSLLYTVLILFVTVQIGLTSDGIEAQAILKTKLDATIAVLQKKDLDTQKKNEQLVAIVTPMFDFQLMAKLSLGRKYWPGLSEEKKGEFTDLFIKRLRASYLEKISLYTDEKVFFKTPVQDKRKVRIPTEIISNNNRISMIYKMYKSKKDWKIYDVEIEGISIISTYRSQFDQVLSKGTMDELLQRLEKPENK